MVKTKIKNFDINNNYIINVKSFDKLIECFKYLCQKALEDNDPRFVSIDKDTNFKILTPKFWSDFKIESKNKNFNFIWTGDVSIYNYKLNKIKNLNKIFVKEDSIKMILDSKNNEWRVATLLKLANIFASSRKYNLDNDVKIILIENLLENWKNIKYKEIKYSFSFYERIIKSVHTMRVSDILENLLINPQTGALHPVREKNSYEGKSIVEYKVNKFLLNCFIYTHYAYKREYEFSVTEYDQNSGPVMENNEFRKYPTKEVTYTRYVMYVPPFEEVNLKINKVGRKFNLESGEIEDVYKAQDSLTYLVNSVFKKVEGFQPLGSKTPVEPTDKMKDLARLAGVNPEAAEEAIWLLNNNYYNELLPAEEALELAKTYGYTAIVEAINKAINEGKVLRYDEDIVLFGNEIYFEDEAADSSSIIDEPEEDE